MDQGLTGRAITRHDSGGSRPLVEEAGEDQAMTLGEQLRQDREALGPEATQEWVAHRIGVRTEAISRWESGHVRKIKARHLAALADLYNADVLRYFALLDDDGSIRMTMVTARTHLVEQRLNGHHAS
jgi:transcriptional regulator with XRE-family HTH domain